MLFSTTQNKPPVRRPASNLTPHERRVLEAWESSGSVTHEQVALKFGTCRSAITRTLKRARLKKYGKALRAGGQKIRMISLSLCLV